MNTLFLFCAFFGLIFLAAQIFLGIGHVDIAHHDLGGHDSHASVHTHNDHNASRSTLNLRTVRGLAAGVMMFGFTGGWLNSINSPWIVTAIGAVGVGLLANLFTAWSFSKFANIETNGAPNVLDIVGHTARAYTTIPAQTEAPFIGSIQASTRSGIIEIPAFSKKQIQIGQQVLVLAVKDGKAEVEEVN